MVYYHQATMKIKINLAPQSLPTFGWAPDLADLPTIGRT